jgi:peptidoglycan-associated lipoprotein
MQKSNSGSDKQAAAPISEARTKSETTAKPGETRNSPPSRAAGTPAKPNSNSAKPADTTSSSSGNAGTKRGASESTAASSIDDEAALLKRRLAEQDAQIRKLRDDQQDGAGREEAGAAAQAEQQSAAAATEQPASPGAASTTSRDQDERAVISANANTAIAGAEDSTGSDSATPQTAERSVYFDYNRSLVPEKYDSMLMANAAYLDAHPNFKVEVQGNCDERGSREYNLALGARRARSVKRALELAGVDGSRIGVISYGSEKPVATGRDEESYGLNRRVDISY